MLFARARSVIAACLVLLFQAPSIRFDSARNVFLLENWAGSTALAPDRYAEVFSVSVDAQDVPAMLGQYRAEGGTLVFSPQFPIQPGVRYRATARIPGMVPLTSIVDIPKPDATPTT